jgi:HAD superfamily hydrolase (TIGR01549 family)
VTTDNIDEQELLLAYDWKPVEGTAPFHDAFEVLESLRTHKIRTGIITNSSEPMWMRDIELDSFGLLRYFPECRIASADVGFLKPHPKIFETALSCLNITPDQGIFVGDNYETDILGAKEIDMRAVLRLGTTIANQVEGAVKPDGIISDLSELLPLLDRWYPAWRK